MSLLNSGLLRGCSSVVAAAGFVRASSLLSLVSSYSGDRNFSPRPGAAALGRSHHEEAQIARAGPVMRNAVLFRPPPHCDSSSAYAPVSAPLLYPVGAVREASASSRGGGSPFSLSPRPEGAKVARFRCNRGGVR